MPKGVYLRTERCRENLSKSHKGYKQTLEHRKNIGLGHLGIKIGTMSEETRKKLSLALKGRVSPMKGKKLSEEAKYKISCNNGSPKGEKHYLWIRDRSLLKDDHRDRGGQLHREWSKTVKNRDNWSCRIADNNCDGKIVAHHILSWSKFPELRYVVNNGITLCHFHHPRKRNDEMKLASTFQELVGVKVN